MTESGRILKDTELSTATEDELRAHYSLIAERYMRIRPDIEPIDVDEAIRSFARFGGCEACKVIYVPAAEARRPLPLTPAEDEFLTSPE
jgi:hypothetical protein